MLDEATSGLDPIIRDDILDILYDFIQDEEHSVFLSSHITGDLEKIADYVAFMKDGRMVFQEEKGCAAFRLRHIKNAAGNDFRDMDCPAFLASREHVFGREILLRDRHSFEAQYPEFVLEDARQLFPKAGDTGRILIQQDSGKVKEWKKTDIKSLNYQETENFILGLGEKKLPGKTDLSVDARKMRVVLSGYD